MSFDDDTDLMESIEACRTCGVFFLTNSNFLRPLFKALDNPEMTQIRLELSSWNVEIYENDGYPQFICTGCIHEFQKIFNFRKSCINTQQQFVNFFYNMHTNNQSIQIKTEIPDETNDFIYIDDLSDTEFDEPFNIPHKSIKEEIIEEATIPEESLTGLIGTECTNLEDNILTDCNKKEIESGFHLSSPERVVAGDTSKLIKTMERCKEEEAEERERQSNKNMITCKYCNYISANKQLHRLHLKRVHEIKDLECHICGKAFRNSTSARLKFHLKWHRLNKHIKCVQCGFYCTSQKIIKDHIYQMHFKDTCAICGKLVLFKKMKCHLTKHGFEKLFECNHCVKVFDNLNDLNEHINFMHSEKTVSKTEFSNQFELEKYMNKHTEEGNNLTISINGNNLTVKDKISSQEKCEFISTLALNYAELNNTYCYKCSQKLMHSDELNQHLEKCQLTTIIENYSMYNDSFNGSDYKISPNYDQLVKNVADLIEKHEPLRPAETPTNQMKESFDEMNSSSRTTFECAKCIYTFDNVEQLKEHHGEIHSDRPNFQCEICGKEFELKFGLNRHLKKHK